MAVIGLVVIAAASLGHALIERPFMARRPCISAVVERAAAQGI